jgi:hypothetical protein
VASTVHSADPELCLPTAFTHFLLGLFFDHSYHVISQKFTDSPEEDSTLHTHLHENLKSNKSHSLVMVIDPTSLRADKMCSHVPFNFMSVIIIKLPSLRHNFGGRKMNMHYFEICTSRVPVHNSITEHVLLKTMAYTFILFIIRAAMSSVLRIEVPSHTEKKEHKK